MKIIVIGSGPSGVHFALTALQKGHDVTMLDVGREGGAIVHPDKDYLGLKQTLDDPIEYFAGQNYQSVSLPAANGEASEYYGLPPSKDYVLERPAGFSVASRGFSPLFSFAVGGLAQCWTAGCYAINDGELEDFPIGFADLAPYYEEVAARIGVTGGEDDLSGYLPALENSFPDLTLDDSSARLLAAYEKKREKLKQKHAVRLGKSRIAALAMPIGERLPCVYCGRCILGCPTGALYTPALTLPDCWKFRSFNYIPHAFVSHLIIGAGEIEGVFAKMLDNHSEKTFKADAYVLASGALGTSNLVLRSVFKKTGDIISLQGLMDNRQILAPFFNTAMIGRGVDTASYQYHQLAAVLPADKPAGAVHGQITTLTVASAHPVLQSLPIDMRSASAVFKNMRGGLGVINLNFSDYRRADNFVTLSDDLKTIDGWPALSIRYAPPEAEHKKFKTALRGFGRFFRDIGAPLIPAMTHTRPMGSSVHYAGTLPMSASRSEWAVTPQCQSYDYSNLFIVDGAVMPALPSKNLTFTLMANATRVASKAL